MAALVPKPMPNVNMTSSVLFRIIQIHKPTILIDEADTYLAEKNELRGILNGGHRRMDAFVWRSVGDDHEPRAFKVWALKCIAMIGRLPDTLEDRALVVALRRKYPHEKVERFKTRRVTELLPLRRKCARWVLDNMKRCCQTNANQSLKGQRSYSLCRTETAPLGKSGGAVQLEI